MMTETGSSEIGSEVSMIFGIWNFK